MKKNILIISTGVLSAYLAQFLLKKNYNIFVTTRKIKKKYLNFYKLGIQKKVNFLKTYKRGVFYIKILLIFCFIFNNLITVLLGFIYLLNNFLKKKVFYMLRFIIIR